MRHKTIFKAQFLAFLLVFSGFLLFSGVIGNISHAQSDETFQDRMYAQDAKTLSSDNHKAVLWGIERIEDAPPALQLEARTALDNAIGGGPVACEVKARAGVNMYAQCINTDDLDLGLFMLQNGYVTADRAVVNGTVFEEAYVQAETEAQEEGLGIWSYGRERSSSVFSSSFLPIGLAIVFCIIAAFAALAFIIRHGFKNIMALQKMSLEIMDREIDLREKEKGIIASMFESELKANKAKIEAHLVVYEEMMRALKDTGKTPRYQKAGDIVQKQPALVRAVFDRNADKLDILGAGLSSKLIHFYARIKTSPEYINIEPEMEVAEVIEIVEEVLKNGRLLNSLVDELIEQFTDSGITDIPE